MTSTGVEQFRFEPTVFSAVRRYPILVLGVALLIAVAAAAYTMLAPEKFQAHASMTVPLPLAVQDQGADQYLDSQVLLLQSDDVARRAVEIANRAAGSKVLSVDDLSGPTGAVVVTPPDKAPQGTYGASTIAVTFTWPDARIAQIGANALLQGFDDARSAAIIAQGQATVAGIEQTMHDARTRDQLADLVAQRTRALVNLQLDLAHHPAISWAVQPEVPSNGSSKQAGAIGLLAGLALGAALAFVRAHRRAGFGNQFDPAALYGVPLVGEIPVLKAKKVARNDPSGAGTLPMSTDPGSAAAEGFRFIAGSLERLRAIRILRRSLVFVAPLPGGSTSALVTNVAVAMAEGGTRVVAVDADPAGQLTGLLLPDAAQVDGFEQVVSGERTLSGCVQPSPLHRGLTVLGAGRPKSRRVAGAAYAKAVRALLAEARDCYDVVLVDSPALLRVADAPALVAAADATVIVVGARELIRDHRAMAHRLDLIGSEILGYVYGTPPPRGGGTSQSQARVAESADADPASETRSDAASEGANNPHTVVRSTETVETIRLLDPAGDLVGVVDLDAHGRVLGLELPTPTPPHNGRAGDPADGKPAEAPHGTPPAAGNGKPTAGNSTLPTSENGKPARENTRPPAPKNGPPTASQATSNGGPASSPNGNPAESGNPAGSANGSSAGSTAGRSASSKVDQPLIPSQRPSPRPRMGEAATPARSDATPDPQRASR